MTLHKIGIPDEEFIRGNVPMTKQEVRILTLAKAAVAQTDTVLDIGAGTGSISIEAALIATKGKVFAVEKNSDAIGLIKKNADKFKVKNITVIEGYAPEAMPDASEKIDVAFIGGSGGQLGGIIADIDKRMDAGGRIVINAVTLETLGQASSVFKERFDGKYAVEVICAQITRMKKAGGYNLFDALNPVYIFTAKK